MPAPVIGGIYLVSDAALALPAGEKREIHERRPVVVLSRTEENTDPAWLVVLVCPLSSSTRRRTRFCVKVSAGEGGVDRKTWVRVSAIQPLAKIDLGTQLGTLPESRLLEVQARLIEYLGLADDLGEDEEEEDEEPMPEEPSGAESDEDFEEPF